MHFNLDTLVGMLYGGGLSGLAAVGINYAAKLPAWIVAREKAKFAALVAAGQLDPATARMLKAQAQALFAWADEELPATPGDRKMDEVLSRLAQVPALGLIVKADPADARKLLESQWAAWRAELAAEAKKDAPQTA